jgi:hypothetical protein
MDCVSRTLSLHGVVIPFADESKAMSNQDQQDQKLSVKLKTFDTVVEQIKQIITISSATLVLSAIFIKDIIGIRTTATVVAQANQIQYKGYLQVAWGLLLLSILAGICVLGAISTHLDEETKKSTEQALADRIHIFSWWIRGFALISALTFIAGISLFLWFAVKNF